MGNSVKPGRGSENRLRTPVHAAKTPLRRLQFRREAQLRVDRRVVSRVAPHSRSTGATYPAPVDTDNRSADGLTAHVRSGPQDEPERPDRARPVWARLVPTGVDRGQPQRRRVKGRSIAAPRTVPPNRRGAGAARLQRHFALAVERHRVERGVRVVVLWGAALTTGRRDNAATSRGGGVRVAVAARMAAEPLVTPNSAGEVAIARAAGYLLRRRAGLDVIAARLDGGDRRGSERATRDGPPVLGRTSGRISGNYPCATPLRTSTLRVVAKRSRERKTRCKERGRAVPPAVPLRLLAMVDAAERSARDHGLQLRRQNRDPSFAEPRKRWSSPHFLWPPLASLSRVCARPRRPSRPTHPPQTTSPAGRRGLRNSLRSGAFVLEPSGGLEPPTPSLPWKCSTG